MVKGITHILKNNAGVQALVGLNAAGDKRKVYPVVCPQTESGEYIVIRQTSKTPIECKGQPTTRIYTYDVGSYHQNYDGAEAMDSAVVEALDWVSGTHNSVVFQEIRHQNTIDGGFTPDGMYSKVSSFEAWVNES